MVFAYYIYLFVIILINKSSLNFSECCPWASITEQQVEAQTNSIDCKRKGIRRGTLLGIDMAENIQSIGRGMAEDERYSEDYLQSIWRHSFPRFAL